MKCRNAVLVSMLLLATLVFAHGNEEHIMGTVSQVTDNSITVETREHQKVTVVVVAETKFMKGTAAANLKDLKVGDRVVIHAAKHGEQVQAHTVRIGAASALAQHQDKSQ